jgi:outer membrane protein OmpA-like peptidoglycan-associated protein/Mg-chelatase subunit ChlD
MAALIPFAVLAICLQATANDDVHIGTPGFQSQIAVETGAGPQRAVVSVLDPAGEPIRDLQPHDFVMARGIRKARVVSVEPLQASQATPVNLVMVIDNSFSMQERGAIKPLLAALDGLLQDVRPIDNVHAVVFSDRDARTVGGRALNVRAFKSNQASEWKRFFAEAFDRGLTTRTYLYEAVLAGLDIVKNMPADEQKLMVVFSDGEDLNSKIGRQEVEAAAFGVKKFQVFSIDYMPREKTDEFLARLARDHHGRIWKARAAAELVPIFQDFKSTILHKYVLTYELLNPIAIEPKLLSFDVPVTTTGDPAAHMLFFPTGQSDIPDPYVQLKNSAEADAFQFVGLTGFSSRYFNILNFVGKALRDWPDARIGIVGCTSGYGPEKDNLALSKGRAEAVKAYLQRIWGIDVARMLIEARNLPADPSSEDTRDGRIENQRVEFIFDSDAAQSRAVGGLIAEAGNRDAVQVKLDLHPLSGSTGSELLIQGNDRRLKTLTAGTEIAPAHSFALDDLGRDRLARLSSIEAVIRVTDAGGEVHEASSDLCQIKANPKAVIQALSFPPYGAVSLEPETVTVEEITVVERSPLLNYVYFDTGRSDIPGRYALFKTAAEARTFDPATLKGTMEKYRHTLNIIGRRAAERPKAKLKIVGCNSGFGEEKGKTDLSRSRAESVRNYLRTIWGIDLARLETEARGLPTAASSGSIPEGRAENQRVEIYADDPAVLDTVQSTYIEALSDTETFKISPEIEPGAALKRWSIEIYGDEQRLDGLTGEGELEPSYVLALKDVGLLNIGSYKTVTAAMEAVDVKGQLLKARDTSTVQFVKREERLARREGYKVFEKYALILFDFDRAEIKDRNRVVVDRIGKRIREIPSATVKIVGHTDAIGKFEYNVALSKKRAETASEQILAGGAAANGRVSFEGKGPVDPLFDNGLPEGRAFNRTVTVILEYEQK